MKFEYDQKIDAFYIRFVDLPYSESDEVRQGIIFDYDKNNKIIGIEILEASKNLSKNFKNFLHHYSPNSHLAANKV